MLHPLQFKCAFKKRVTAKSSIVWNISSESNNTNSDRHVPMEHLNTQLKIENFPSHAKSV